MNPSERRLSWIFVLGGLLIAVVVAVVVSQYRTLSSTGAERVEMMRDYVARAQAIHPGRVAMTALDQEGERPVYKVMIVSNDGAAREFYFDVATDELLNP
jgi:hypothetical protein